MISRTLSNYIGVSEQEINRLLSMTPQNILQDATYHGWVDNLDHVSLEGTLPLARDAYENGLPDFMAKLKHDYDFEDTPMSAFTLANWLIGFLHTPDELAGLLDMHGNVPPDVLRKGLPELLAILDTMPKGAREWQQAMAILSLPLIAQ